MKRSGMARGRWLCRGLGRVMARSFSRTGLFGWALVVMFVVLYLGSIVFEGDVSVGGRYRSGIECAVGSGQMWIWYGRSSVVSGTPWEWQGWFGLVPVSEWRVELMPRLGREGYGSWIERSVAVPLWMPIVLMLALQAARGWVFKPWRCRWCRHDLRGFEGSICPECGGAKGER